MSAGVLGPDEGEAARATDRLRRALPAVLAVALLAAGLVAVTGPVGLAIAATAAIAWALASGPYALAAGHVALATLAPAGMEPLAIAIVEAGFAAVLAAALLREPAPGDALPAAALALLVTGAVAWAAVATLPLWGAGTVVLLFLGAVGYAIHRYQLAAFGLVADGTGRAGTGGPPGAADDRERARRRTDATTTSTSTSDS